MKGGERQWREGGGEGEQGEGGKDRGGKERRGRREVGGKGGVVRVGWRLKGREREVEKGDCKYSNFQSLDVHC